MTTTTKIKIRRGPLSDLKTIQLDDGELGVTTDTKELYVGVSGINNSVSKLRKELVPIDYNNKQNGVGFFKRISGTGTLSYDSSESAMGAGCFSITGNGTWVIDDFGAIAPLYGIGGQIVAKGVANYVVGCEFYDASGNLLAGTNVQNNFIMDNIIGTSVFELHENYVKTEGSGINTMPVGARFARPFITISGNSGVVKFDHFDVYHLGSISFFY